MLPVIAGALLLLAPMPPASALTGPCASVRAWSGEASCPFVISSTVGGRLVSTATAQPAPGTGLSSVLLTVSCCSPVNPLNDQPFLSPPYPYLNSCTGGGPGASTCNADLLIPPGLINVVVSCSVQGTSGTWSCGFEPLL